MKWLKITLILLALGVCAATCKKSGSKQNAAPAITIQGFILTDYNGNLLGWYGTPDSDWKIRPTLSAAEMALFQFNTNLSLDNTTETTLAYNIAVFPNPAWLEQRFTISPLDSNVGKIVFVDSTLRVLQDTAVKVKGPNDIPLHLSDTTLFPNHSSRRIYFSFSAAGHPDYAKGYGDIRICNQTAVTGCF